MATQAELIRDIRSRIDEPQEGLAFDFELRRWVNEAVRDMARRSEWGRDSKAVAVTADTHTVTLNTANLGASQPQIFRLHRLTWAPTGETTVYPLRYKDMHSADQYWGSHKEITQANTPSFYTTWETPPILDVVLYPTPSVAGTLNVFYYKVPVDLVTDTDTDAGTEVDVPTGWFDMIVDYVEFRYFMKDQKPDRAALAMTRYEQNLSQLTRLSARYVDQPGSFDYGGGYPGWDDPGGWDDI